MCFYAIENNKVQWDRNLCRVAGLSSSLDHGDTVKWLPQLECSTKGKQSLYNGWLRRQGRATALCKSALSSSWGWQSSQVTVNGKGKQRSIPNTERKRAGSGNKKSPGSTEETLSSVPAEMSIGVLDSTAIECAQAYHRQEGLVEICRWQKEG